LLKLIVWERTLHKKIVIIICHLFFLDPLFPQTVSFDEQVQKFADAVNPTLPFAANMGLNWSTPYVGQLIGYPMHFGIGVFLGSAFMSNNEPAALGETMGISIEESMIKGKQWFPNYVVAVRVGGFAGLPFDIGAKFGLVPDTALWGSLDYNSWIIGVDIHYALYVPKGNGPVIAVSLGYDRLEGGVTGTVTTVPGGTQDVTTDMPAHIVWESNTVKAQAIISQQLLATGLSFFGSIDLGFGMNKAGVKFGHNLDSPVYKNMKDVSTLLLSGSVGVGYEIGVFRIDASFMWNFINFESGINFGIRYQR
jgi:hypothetical protein